MLENNLETLQKETARMNTLLRFEHYGKANRQAARVRRHLRHCQAHSPEEAQLLSWARASLQECDSRAGFGASLTRHLLALIVLAGGSLATCILTNWMNAELHFPIILPLLLGIAATTALLGMLGLIPMHLLLKPDDSELNEAGAAPWWLWWWVASR